MSRRNATAAMAVLLASLAPAGAPRAFVSNKTFLSDCSAPADAVQRAECRGYILGVADAINSNVVKGRRICFPGGAEQDEIREQVMRWVRANAHVVQRMNGFGAIYAALIKSYPCAK